MINSKKSYLDCIGTSLIEDLEPKDLICYSCYNAFSRLDMRVQVTIPGTVESYCIDERGVKRVASESLWLETYLCAVLRSYSYADDGGGDMIRKIVGVRRFNPITNTESEHKFMDAAERLFFKGDLHGLQESDRILTINSLGWQLGSDPEIQVPNLVSNHLTAGLLQYIHTTGRYASGMNLFEKLRTRDPEISSILARVLISADEEVRAVALLHESIQQLPMDYSLLDVQAAFCKDKGRGDLALECAKRSVIAAPSEFGTWSRLAEIYVSLEEWELALLTLNSCPMFTYQDKDSPGMPEPSARVILPLLPESSLDEISEDVVDDSSNVHPTLRKLPAASYKGTFLKAYSLLTEVAAKIGWDQLLKIRSQVFVMEEEYRTEKQASSGHHGTASKSSSTTALKGTSDADVNGTAAGESQDGPTEHLTNGDHAGSQESITGTTVAGTMRSAGADALDQADEQIEKPEHTVTSEVVKSGGEDVSTLCPPFFTIKCADQKQPDSNNSHYGQFQNKRLCERWLDNLIMVLYEDLRVYTMWRTEMAQYKQQSLQYKKSAEEWEILGELAERLHHPDEAIEAYAACLDIRFSPKAMKGLLALHEREGDVRSMLAALIRLIAWQYRWYSEVSLAQLLFIALFCPFTV